MRLLPLLFLLACHSEYVFTELSPQGAALTSAEDSDARVRQDRFALGGNARTPLVDYLFVVDNSISMRTLLPKFLSGVETLANDPTAFGDRARIAVITTLPADPDVPGALHPSVRLTPGIEYDPGFGAPVSETRVREYVAAAPHMRRRMNLPGCNAWFSPDEKSEYGNPCLQAHMQVGLTPVRVEAGLTAFGQLLDTKDFSFRRGAAVNVVFVSDTHDPGIDLMRHAFAEDMVALRPKVSDLQDAVKARFDTSAFRLHAIAPATVCTNEDWSSIGPVYKTAAETTGGVFIDICTAEDYRPLLEAITDVGAQPSRAVLTLGRPATEILSVTVDGASVNFTELQGAIELVAMPTEKADVEVLYRFE